MSQKHVVDHVAFFRRLSVVYKQWQADTSAQTNGPWNGARGLAFWAGSVNEDNIYAKTLALQLWLLGYEFPDTIMILTSKKIVFLTSTKKIRILQTSLEKDDVEKPVTCEYIERTKDNQSDFVKLLDVLDVTSGASIGILANEKQTGDFARDWSRALDEAGAKKVNVVEGVAQVLAVKDESELENMKKAAIATSRVMQRFLVRRIEEIVDEEKKVTHSQLAEEVEDLLQSPTKLAEYNIKVSGDAIDSCYTPIIQSGGSFNLRASAQSNDELIYHDGTIMCSMGIRYKSFCSNSARTLLINPTKEQEEQYKLLLELHEVLCKQLRPGSKLGDVYDAVVHHVQEKKPAMARHLFENCGFGMGIEFLESFYRIDHKNQRQVQSGMVFNAVVGFKDLETNHSDPKARKYALMIADTVMVKGETAEVMTSPSKSYKDISYYLNEDAPEEPPPRKPAPSKEKKGRKEAIDVGALSSKRGQRNRDTSKDIEEKERRRQEHQQALGEMKLEQSISRFTARGRKDTVASSTGDVYGNVVAYADPSELPRDMKNDQMYVDMERDTLIVPVGGTPVPFHVTTIKSVSKVDEGEFKFLRVNFYTPGQALGNKGIVFQEPNRSYVREVSVRSQDSANISEVHRLINELLKRLKQRQQEARERRDIEEVGIQEAIVLGKGAQIPRLTDLTLRPTISGRKTTGTLEAHKNGFRFHSVKNENVDVLYDNIRHAFLQPAENEIVVLLHFNLRRPIMVGKKKVVDIQFYTEVMEASQSLDQSRRSGWDPDEIEEEQRELELRKRLNDEFKNYVSKVEDHVEREDRTLKFDIPYRDLGFFGVPGKSSVLMMPSVDCLVSLTEWPPVVIALEDVEIVHFERVAFSLRNFDMVMVFKNFDKPVVHINSIPMDSLDQIKEWLDSVNIKYYEGPASLNWKNIMETVRTDPGQFFQEGGWKFLELDGSDEEGGNEEDAESEFDPEDGEEAEEVDSDEYAMDEEEEESGSEGAAEDEDDDALDWDELEEKTRREEELKRAKRGHHFESDDDDDERPRKRSGKNK